MAAWANATVWSQHGEKQLSAGGEHYALKDVLGEGGYGSVYRCIRASDESLFALKLIDPVRIGFYSGEAGIRQLEALAAREVSILKKLSGHPGIISLEDAFRAEDSKQLFLLTEFIAGGDLFSQIVDSAVPFQESEAAYVTAQLADALAFCHSKGIAHRDAKPENVLVKHVSVRLSEVGSSWKTERLLLVKLCDFGFAKFLQGYETRTPIGLGGGTPTYSAPECISEFDPGSRDWLEQAPFYDPFKADAYSLGVIVFIMLCQLYPERDGEGWHRRNHVWCTFTPQARFFIDDLLCADPSKRLSVVAAGNHSWLASQKTTFKESTWNDTVWVAPQSTESPACSPSVNQKDSFLPALLALHRGLVLLQRERAMAGYVLARAPACEGTTILALDHFQLHSQCIDQQMSKTDGLLEHLQDPRNSRTSLNAVMGKLREVRKRVINDLNEVCSASFDEVFVAYNHACGALIDIAAMVLQTRESPGVAKAVQRYRLFSAAAEQLGRERAFVCGHGQTRVCDGRGIHVADLPPEKLRRLVEIIGARKVLIGTSKGQDLDPASGDIFTSSQGMVGALLDGAEPVLLSVQEISELESIEDRVLNPDCRSVLLTTDWFETLTRHVNAIHSRITLNFLEDAQLPVYNSSGIENKMAEHRSDGMLCHKGLTIHLKKLLQKSLEHITRGLLPTDCTAAKI